MNEKNINRKTQLKSSGLLLLAAVVWGISFVTQKIGGDLVGPFTFNGLRMLLGSGAVYIAILVLDRFNISHKPANRQERKTLWKAGFLCGIFLFLASNLQQVGLSFDISSGKAGFLTALYIVLVPILGIFFHKKCSWNVWAAVAVAVVGLYFMCITESFSISLCDLLFFGCALCFAFQIIWIDKYTDIVDGLRLSCIEFLITGVLTMVIALFTEIIPFEGGISGWLAQFSTWKFWFSFLYMGLMSCGIGYTLQIFGMRGLNPTIATLLMSLESTFALISGIVFLNQKISLREGIGCAIMFIAICLAQINFKKSKN